MKWPVVEIFESINGEGRRAGELAVFIRFKGCNLKCAWCDTTWANQPTCPSQDWDLDALLNHVSKLGILNVTLTGGEPLLQPHIDLLIQGLLEKGFRVEVETNGTFSIESFASIRNQYSEHLTFTMDSKLGGSGCKDQMHPDALKYLQKQDSLKFVVSNSNDLEEALEIITNKKLLDKTQVFFSPCHGSIELQEIVSFMLKNRLNEARIQLQMHKIIWSPETKGV